MVPFRIGCSARRHLSPWLKGQKDNYDLVHHMVIQIFQRQDNTSTVSTSHVWRVKQPQGQCRVSPTRFLSSSKAGLHVCMLCHTLVLLGCKIEQQRCVSRCNFGLFVSFFFRGLPPVYLARSVMHCCIFVYIQQAQNLEYLHYIQPRFLHYPYAFAC